MSNKFSIEIIEAPMTNNTEQKSAFWLMLDQDIDDHNSIVDHKTLIEQFVIECGKYGDTAQIPDEVIETYIRREKRKIEESIRRERIKVEGVNAYHIIVDIINKDFFKDVNGNFKIFTNYDDALLHCGIHELENAWVCQLIHNHRESNEKQ